VHGFPTENSARLFDDYGVELTSFTSLGVDEDLLLVVTNGEVRNSMPAVYFFRYACDYCCTHFSMSTHARS
jgi:hypothetical protein